VELVQVRVGLPFLEQQLDLPAEAIQFCNDIDRKRRARQVRAQPRHRLFLAGKDDDAKADEAPPALVLDVEIHAPGRVLCDEAPKPYRLGQRHALAVDPSSAYPRIVAT